MADQALEEQVDETPLAPRQAAFVREYLTDFNATQAYIRAGYSPHTAGVGASQLLDNPKVFRAVEAGKAARAARVAVTQEYVLQEMSLLANSNLEHYVITDDGQVALADGAPEGAMRAIQSIKKKTKIFPGKNGEPGHKEYDVEIKLWDKPNPLKLMGKHVNLFADRMEHTGKDGAPLIPISGITVTVVDPKEAT